MCGERQPSPCSPWPRPRWAGGGRERAGVGQEGHDHGGRHQPDRGAGRRRYSDVASLLPQDNPNSPGTGPTYHLKPGRYLISGDVPTPTSNPNVVNQTLVVRQVNVRTGGTIKLDSRGGKLLTVFRTART